MQQNTHCNGPSVQSQKEDIQLRDATKNLIALSIQMGMSDTLYIACYDTQSQTPNNLTNITFDTERVLLSLLDGWLKCLLGQLR